MCEVLQGLLGRGSCPPELGGGIPARQDPGPRHVAAHVAAPTYLHLTPPLPLVSRETGRNQGHPGTQGPPALQGDGLLCPSPETPGPPLPPLLMGSEKWEPPTPALLSPIPLTPVLGEGDTAGEG